MRRAGVLVAMCIAGIGAAACSALLDLNERTLRSADASSDAPLDVSGPCDGGFCACHPHDFCEDFDTYTSPNELKQRWKNSVGFPASPVEYNGQVRFDPTTLIPPSIPNALLTRTDAKDKGALAAAFVQLDGQALHPENVIGIKLTVQVRIDLLDPEDGSAPIRDSGIHEAIGLVELISSTGANGVGVLLTEEGGYVGYAVNVNDLTKATLVQGLPFSIDKLVPPKPVFFPFTVIVAPRTSAEVGNVACQQGPVINLGDADPDAATGTNPLVILVIPPLGFGTKVCEILGGDLLDPSWVRTPVLALGSVHAGAGAFQSAFDDVTIDFLTK